MSIFVDRLNYFVVICRFTQRNETLKNVFDYTVIELIEGKNSGNINGLNLILNGFKRTEDGKAYSYFFKIIKHPKIGCFMIFIS